MDTILKFASAMMNDPCIKPSVWWSQLRETLYTEENIEALLELSLEHNNEEWVNFFSEQYSTVKCPYCDHEHMFGAFHSCPF